jgi:osmotically-inducible protein OsmY
LLDLQAAHPSTFATAQEPSIIDKRPREESPNDQVKFRTSGRGPSGTRMYRPSPRRRSGIRIARMVPAPSHGKACRATRVGKEARKEHVMSITLTTHDHMVKDLVVGQLTSDPEFDATLVGVSAKDGIVTLSGYVETYAAKLAAERAARRVYGVAGVANELEVKLAIECIDPDIARAAVEALRNRIDVPLGVTVTVRNGVISLAGTVEWMYQKMSAERAVKYLRGVKGVFNHIVVKPTIAPKDIQKRITEALHRHADIDARRIHVESEGNTVILSGTVSSWMEKDEAQRAAWRAPGITAVENRINVVP